MKVIATEVFANGSSVDNDDATTTVRSIPQRQPLSEDLTSSSGSDKLNVSKSTILSGRNRFVKDTHAKNLLTEPSSNRVNISSDGELKKLSERHATSPKLSHRRTANIFEPLCKRIFVWN